MATRDPRPESGVGATGARSPARTRQGERPSVGRIATLVFGLVFLGVAIWGFALTGFDDFADHDTGEEILGLFEVNPLHNTAHLLFGILGIVAALRLSWSFAYNAFVAVAYGGLFVLGLFMVDEDWDFLALNWSDNWLHLALAALGGIIAAICYRELREYRDRTSIDLRDQPKTAPAGRTASTGRPRSQARR